MNQSTRHSFHSPTDTQSSITVEDKVENGLRAISQNTIAIVFGLLPLFFIPIAAVPFSYSKVIFVIFGVFISIIFFSLSVLRTGSVRIAAPVALLGLWGVAIVTALSGIVSGDLRDAFVGDTMSIHTASFIGLLALVATVMSVVGHSKTSIMRLYFLLAFSVVILTLFHTLRILFGPQLLTFGIFTDASSSPIGPWNDLGLLSGLIVLIGMVALEQLPLTKWGRILFLVLVVLSLGMLSVVNFFAIWVVLGLVSLVQLMYTLTRDRFSDRLISDRSDVTISVTSVVLSAGVFVVSLLFMIGGSGIGSFINQYTDISFVQVRPSLESTIDIARNVYQENAFVGIGPNKFIDAWRLYKDPSINQTVFWETDFSSGNGYISTMFVTTGILGVFAWLTFFGLFLWAGFKMLILSPTGDRFWYFIGSSSFVAAVYIWGMACIYTPGPTIVLLGGVFTSIVFVAYGALVYTKPISLSIASHKRAGIILVGCVMVLIVSSASVLYYAGRNFAAVVTFSQAMSTISTTTSIEAVEQMIGSAYLSSKNDAYVRQIAQLQIAKMNALLQVADPTVQQQQQFQAAAAEGINAAQLAISSDTTDPRNHATVGTIYSILAVANVDGAADRAKVAFAQARTYDPQNPLYDLLEAQLNSQLGNLVAGRESAIRAVTLKPNYTAGLFLLSQIDIADGNVAEAIQTTEAIVSLEPNNPARFYQLGVLYSSEQNTIKAIQNLERAVALSPDYSNARYFLALAYAKDDRINEAVAQLTRVQELNPDNTNIGDLIQRLEAGESFETVNTNVNESLPEEITVTNPDGTVTTTEEPDTPLVSTVNTVPNELVEATEPVSSDLQTESDTTE